MSFNTTGLAFGGSCCCGSSNPTLQQVLTAGNTSVNLNLDLTNGSLISNAVYTNTVNSINSGNLTFNSTSDLNLISQNNCNITAPNGLNVTANNLTISSNSPTTTYNDFQGYLAGGTGTGSFNVCMGRRSGRAFTTAQNNSLIGYSAGDRLTSGNNNIMINCNAIIDTGDDNVILGNNSTSLVSLTNTKVIGNNNLVNHSNSHSLSRGSGAFAGC